MLGKTAAGKAGFGFYVEDPFEHGAFDRHVVGTLDCERTLSREVESKIKEQSLVMDSGQSCTRSGYRYLILMSWRQRNC